MKKWTSSFHSSLVFYKEDFIEKYSHSLILDLAQSIFRPRLWLELDVFVLARWNKTPHFHTIFNESLIFIQENYFNIVWEMHRKSWGKYPVLTVWMIHMMINNAYFFKGKNILKNLPSGEASNFSGSKGSFKASPYVYFCQFFSQD